MHTASIHAHAQHAACMQRAHAFLQKCSQQAGVPKPKVDLNDPHDGDYARVWRVNWSASDSDANSWNDGARRGTAPVQKAPFRFAKCARTAAPLRFTALFPPPPPHPPRCTARRYPLPRCPAALPLLSQSTAQQLCHRHRPKQSARFPQAGPQHDVTPALCLLAHKKFNSDLKHHCAAQLDAALAKYASGHASAWQNYTRF